MDSNHSMRHFFGFILLNLCLSLSGCEGGYPSPVLYEFQVQQFEEQDKVNPPPQHGIVIFGSSTIQLWSSINDDLAPLPIIARGFYGNTLNDARYYADRMIVNYEPEIIVIYGGDNDISYGITPERVYEVFLELVEKIRVSLPDTPIYFISIKPSPTRWGGWPARATVNELIRDLCDEDYSLNYIDTASFMISSDGAIIDSYFDDGLHLSEEGYEVWTSVIQPILNDGYYRDFETANDQAQ